MRQRPVCGVRRLFDGNGIRLDQQRTDAHLKERLFHFSQVRLNAWNHFVFLVLVLLFSLNQLGQFFSNPGEILSLFFEFTFRRPLQFFAFVSVELVDGSHRFVSPLIEFFSTAAEQRRSCRRTLQSLIEEIHLMNQRIQLRILQVFVDSAMFIAKLHATTRADARPFAFAFLFETTSRFAVTKKHSRAMICAVLRKIISMALNQRSSLLFFFFVGQTKENEFCFRCSRLASNCKERNEWRERERENTSDDCPRDSMIDWEAHVC